LAAIWYAEFALDLSNGERGGEAPFVTSYGSPYEYKNDRVDESFGHWLLATLNTVLPLSREMWQKRIAYPNHEISTKEYGQAGSAVFFSECKCGWRSHLKRPISEAAKDGEAHVANPSGMRAEPYWD